MLEFHLRLAAINRLFVVHLNAVCRSMLAEHDLENATRKERGKNKSHGKKRGNYREGRVVCVCDERSKGKQIGQIAS